MPSPLRDAAPSQAAEPTPPRGTSLAAAFPHGRIYHLIGRQGCGKSSVAALIAGGLQSMQRDCRVLDSDAARHVSNAELRASMAPGEISIVEADHRGPRHIDLMRGDFVITVERGEA